MILSLYHDLDGVPDSSPYASKSFYASFDQWGQRTWVTVDTQSDTSMGNGLIIGLA